MNQLLLCSTLCALWIPGATARAADYQTKALDEPAPADGLSAAIRETLAPTGIKVTEGSSRSLCDIWLCKEWPVETLEAGGDLIYPFTPGQLIGVVRFGKSSGDFREQEIERGVYTMRYAQQPVDGNHVGTSATRDFLLLVRAADDTSPEATDYEPLTQQSAEAAGTSHPALLSMKRVPDDGKTPPAIRHDQDHDFWIVRLQGSARAGDQKKALAIDLVVVGMAIE